MTTPEGLGARGRELWEAFEAEVTLSGTGAVLALEACRCVDRLERLDRYMAGEAEWLDLVERIEGSGRYEVVVNAPLAEARQQQGRLSQLVEAVVKTKPSSGTGSVKGGGGGLDDLGARRAQRIAEASDSHPS